MRSHFQVYPDGGQRSEQVTDIDRRGAFDWSGRPPSQAVVEAVADVTGEDVTALPPLNDTLDPDALDALFAPRNDRTNRHGGSTSFRFAGCRVTLYSEGRRLVVREETDADGD